MYVCVSGGAFVSDPHIPVHGPCGKRSWAQNAGYTLTLWKVYLDGENGKGESVRTVIGAAGQPGDDDLDLRPSDAHAIGRYVDHRESPKSVVLFHRMKQVWFFFIISFSW